MIRITGSATFSRKEEFKDFGGVWNGDLKAWEFRDGANVDRWRGIPGLVITGPEPKPTPPVPRQERKPEPLDDDFWEKLFAPKPRDVPKGTEPPAVHGNDITYLNAFTPKNPPMFAGFASFPDLIDFVEQINPAISSQNEFNRNSGWRPSHGDAWNGTADMPAAINLARNGWDKGTRLALEASEIITGDHATQRVRKYGVAGGRVNVGRMLSGNPLHMVSRPRQAGSRVITLFVQTWMSAAITAENAIIRAASVAAIADVLQGHGFSCEIVAVGTSTHGGRNGLGAQVATVVKAAGEPLNIENVVFALGHPSMLRRFMFAVCAIEPRLQSFWSGMGGQIDAFDPDDLAPGQFYIPKLTMQDQKLVKGDTFKDRVRSLFPLIVPDGSLGINLA